MIGQPSVIQHYSCNLSLILDTVFVLEAQGPITPNDSYPQIS